VHCNADIVKGGDGVYIIPGYHELVYCGLEGWMHPLRSITENNDLGHPLCAHLRDGVWAMDYILKRLDKWVTVKDLTSI
jgi:glycogen debranching enzyme